MERQGGRVAPVTCVTVDAAGELSVLQQRALTEGTKFPLVDAHMAVYLIAGLNQAIGQAIVDSVFGDIYRERVETPPCAVKQTADSHHDGVSDASFQQSLPSPFRKTG